MDFSSLSRTVPLLLAGMAGIFVVLGVLILAIYLLNWVFSGK